MSRIIMIQGTASGVGKSMVATALCRILCQEGYSVAPFKAQNMSDRLYTLSNGDMLAHSQVIQAHACNVDPHTDMNPIVLVPKGNGTTDVILNGKLIDNMDRSSYDCLKKEARLDRKSVV